MSIYNRPYMREDFSRPAKTFDALKTILISLVVIFILQKIFQGWINPELLGTWFGLSVPGVASGRIYTFLSYGYLHSTVGVVPWHLMINSLIIYFVGKHIQERFGAQRFLELYHLCILAGAATWFSIELIPGNLPGGSGLLVGASAAGYGLLTLFCLLQWTERMTIYLYFLIPITFTGKVGFYLILGIQAFFFLFAELQGASGVAYSAHLGGIGAAYLYYQFLLSRPTLLSAIQNLGGAPKRTPPTGRASTGRFTLNLKQPPKSSRQPTPSGPGLRTEVDRILDKINSEGFGALTDEEKRTLDQAKDKLS